MPESRGGSANRQGRVLEQTVIPTFVAHGFEVVPYSRWSKYPDRYGHDLLLKHVPYTTIYGHNGFSEFMATSQRLALAVRIECKWQQSSGSVDEKFPYLYLNCVEALPENDILVVVGGGGFKAGAVEWFKKAVEERRFLPPDSLKNISVLTLDEFLQWANRTLR